MTDWDFDTHRARIAREGRIVRRLGYAVMTFAAVMILGFIFTAAYVFSTVSLDDIARKAGELTRTFEDATQ